MVNVRIKSPDGRKLGRREVMTEITYFKATGNWLHPEWIHAINWKHPDDKLHVGKPDDLHSFAFLFKEQPVKLGAVGDE